MCEIGSGMVAGFVDLESQPCSSVAAGVCFCAAKPALNCSPSPPSPSLPLSPPPNAPPGVPQSSHAAASPPERRARGGVAHAPPCHALAGGGQAAGHQRVLQQRLPHLSGLLGGRSVRADPRWQLLRPRRGGDLPGGACGAGLVAVGTQDGHCCLSLDGLCQGSLHGSCMNCVQLHAQPPCNPNAPAGGGPAPADHGRLA